MNLRPRGLAGRSGRLRLLAVIPVLVTFAFVAAGCDKLKGGGWIPSLMPGQKATFGFSARCKNTTVDSVPSVRIYEGQFEFDDHAANPLVVRVHGDVEPVTLEGRCEDFPDDVPASTFIGEYRTQPKVGPSSQGLFQVDVVDGGEPGIDGDSTCVTLFGDVAYTNCGDVQGGNIQVQ